LETRIKLTILADAAKHDASCASSGAKRSGNGKGVGHATGSGICHSYAPDGRCISLLKLLLTNYCILDCQYCVNRVSSDVPRARFAIEEVVNLTLDFYRRNYIEGLFLSSGIIRSGDYTMEQLVEVARQLREVHHFGGYIHRKAVPGASEELLRRAGRYADRLSANIDRDILATADHLYRRHALRRVYYSAYSPIPHGDARLPPQAPPLVREHRLYQADWLVRFYGFNVIEITTADAPQLDLSVDPKLAWTMRNRWFFPVDVNHAAREKLFRVPGLGKRTVDRLVTSRRFHSIRMDHLAKLRVPLGKVRPLVTAQDHNPDALRIDRSDLRDRVVKPSQQLELFDLVASARSGEV
jgi:predicted DNA-binding helix-hairpin-helix protein